MAEDSGTDVIGTAMAVVAAISYGVTIVANRELAGRGFGPAATLSVRFSISAVVTLSIVAVARRPLLPAAGERGRVLGLGMIGYSVQSALFYAALQRGTAAAVALLFYVYPALVAITELVVGRLRASARVFVALTLSLGGTGVIVVAGSRVVISNTGIALALVAAAIFAGYLLVSDRLVARTDPLTSGGWVALGAAISLTTFGAASGQLQAPGTDVWLMAVSGTATSSAFVLLFAALRRLGASRTAIVMTLEAFSAVVLAALLLGEALTSVQAVGGTAILTAVVLLSLSRRSGGEIVPEQAAEVTP